MIDKKIWRARLHDAVMFENQPCPFCSGESEKHDMDKRPRCGCQELRWKRKVIERILPRRYTHNNIWTLEPSPASKLTVERQTVIIDSLKKPENLNSGYLFYGEPGTSKSTLATCLVRHAIERDWYPWFWRTGPMKWNNDWIRYINWDNLLGEYMAYQNDRDADPPTISASVIKKVAESGRRPVLCLEEIDKSRLTEYKANKLFDFVQAMDANMGQLIITTNHRTIEELQAFLYKTEDATINLAGEAVWRRIVDNCTPVKFSAQD